ncbi:MAG: nuclease, partial [Candidatus Omnitrophota bacterium]
EITTKTGRAAKRFLIAALKPCPFLIVKTYQPDKFDRYLVEVFYLPGEEDETKVAAEGRFLNQELLDNRLAGGWRET